MDKHISIIDGNNGREIGLHIGGRLVGLRFGGKREAFVPPFENRSMGQRGVCPLILQAFKLKA